MPAPNDVFRVTLNWRNASGQSTHNVLHFSAPGQTEATLGAQIDTVFGTLAAASHLGWPIPASWTLSDLDISEPFAGTAAVTYTLTHPQTGGASGDPIWQAAGIVTLRTAAAGPQGRGRVYLGPCAEDANDSGVLDPTGRAVCQTAWTKFKNDMATASMPLGVLSDVHSTWRTLTGAQVRSYIATQRRRARFLQ